MFDHPDRLGTEPHLQADQLIGPELPRSQFAPVLLADRQARAHERRRGLDGCEPGETHDETPGTGTSLPQDQEPGHLGIAVEDGSGGEPPGIVRLDAHADLATRTVQPGDPTHRHHLG